MDKIRKHFEDAANAYDARVLKTVPFYKDMIGALVSALPFAEDRKISVVDLGCGTGTISKEIKERYPDAAVTCVDFADNMISIAKGKLKDYRDIEYVTGDCRSFDLSRGYDAVVSSLTLHHISDGDEKKDFYRKVLAGLHPGGVFYAADLVRGPTEYLQDLNLEKWKEFLLKSVSEEEISRRRKSYEEEDHPFCLADELSWLKEAGFCHVDVVWKYYHFAVYGGSKK